MRAQSQPSHHHNVVVQNSSSSNKNNNIINANISSPQNSSNSNANNKRKNSVPSVLYSDAKEEDLIRWINLTTSNTTPIRGGSMIRSSPQHRSITKHGEQHENNNKIAAETTTKEEKKNILEENDDEIVEYVEVTNTNKNNLFSTQFPGLVYPSFENTNNGNNNTNNTLPLGNSTSYRKDSLSDGVRKQRKQHHPKQTNSDSSNMIIDNFVANSTVPRHHVVSAEADQAFQSLARSAIRDAPKKLLRFLLMKVFDCQEQIENKIDPVDFLRQNLFFEKMNNEDDANENNNNNDNAENSTSDNDNNSDSDSDDDDDDEDFDKRIENIKKSLVSENENEFLSQFQQYRSSSLSSSRGREDRKLPNTMAVSLRAGLSSSSGGGEETIRIIISTCTLFDHDSLILDVTSLFRVFDDERWCDPLTLSVHNISKPKLNRIEILRLVGEYPICKFQNRPVVPLRNWPLEKKYYHGIGRSVLEPRCVSSSSSSLSNKEKSSSSSTTKILQNEEDALVPLVTFPSRMVSLQPCEALNGELEVVAKNSSNRGVLYGTAFVYGGLVAEPRVKSKTSTTSASKNIHTSSSTTTTETKSTNNTNNSEEISDEVVAVDVEQFIYSYELGGNQILLGSSVPRYINHKMNFSPSGNVQFANLILPAPNATTTTSTTTTTTSTKSKKTSNNKKLNINQNQNDDSDNEEEDDDDDTDEDNDVEDDSASPATASNTNKSGTRRKRKTTTKNTKKTTSSSKSSQKQQLITIPFFFVSRDIPHGDTFLADSYGATYDAEMERYAASSNVPLSAVDAGVLNLYHFLISSSSSTALNPSHHHHHQETIQKLQRYLFPYQNNNNNIIKKSLLLNQNSSSVSSSSSIPKMSIGYDANYRVAIERGSVLACCFKKKSENNNTSNDNDNDYDVALFYVHQVCWGDSRIAETAPVLDRMNAICAGLDDSFDIIEQQEQQQQEQEHQQDSATTVNDENISAQRMSRNQQQQNDHHHQHSASRYRQTYSASVASTSATRARANNYSNYQSAKNNNNNNNGNVFFNNFFGVDDDDEDFSNNNNEMNDQNNNNNNATLEADTMGLLFSSSGNSTNNNNNNNSDIANNSDPLLSSNSSVHSVRLRRYFHRSIDIIPQSEKVRASKFNSRFVLAERLVERVNDQITSSEKEALESLVSVSFPSCSSTSSSTNTEKETQQQQNPTKARIFMRPSSPSKLHAKGATVNNLNGNAVAGSPADPNCVVLDASSCVLCLSSRDGVWPFQFDADETGGDGSLEVVVFTGTEKMLENSTVLCDAASEDSVVFPLLRRMEPKF